MRLAGLLAEARKDAKTDAAAVERNLKRTQVFQGETTMVFVVWEDYQAALSLSAETDGKTAVPVERIISADSGLVMLDFGKNASDLSFKVEQSNRSLKREVPYTLLIVRYDGKSFQIEEREGTAMLPDDVV